jgi:hypothetical protein
MPLSPDDEEQVHRLTGGKIFRDHGPFAFLDGQAHEVWVRKSDTDEEVACYIFTRAGQKQLFENFKALAVYTQAALADEAEAFEARIAALVRTNAAESNRKLVLNSVVSIVMFFLFASVSWVTFGQVTDGKSLLLVLIAAVVASAAIVIFGKFVVPNLPRSRDP